MLHAHSRFSLESFDFKGWKVTTDVLNQTTKGKYLVINLKFITDLKSVHEALSQQDMIHSTQQRASLNRWETGTWEAMRDCSL